MVAVVESFLSLLEHEAKGASGSTVAATMEFTSDMIPLHMAVLEALERRIGTAGLNEAHRPLIPLFQRWIGSARNIARAASEVRRQGQDVPGIDGLMFGINRAKPAADEFDYWVQRNREIISGNLGKGRPLDEVMDELHRRDHPED